LRRVRPFLIDIYLKSALRVTVCPAEISDGRAENLWIVGGDSTQTVSDEVAARPALSVTMRV
jgi:hypothetical protein